MDSITYKCIEDIGGFDEEGKQNDEDNKEQLNKWKIYRENKWTKNNKEYRNTDLMVWTDKGFTKI